MLDRSPTAATPPLTDALPLLWLGFVELLPWLLVAAVSAVFGAWCRALLQRQ